MTVILYKNSQTAGAAPHEVYTDRWELTPYHAPTLFHEGETTGQGEFVIPEGYTVKQGKFLKWGREVCKILTDPGGRPRPAAGRYADPGVPLFLVEETSGEEETAPAGEEEEDRYAPQMRNGEWDIW
jgi:hypothetical protein